MTPNSPTIQNSNQHARDFGSPVAQTFLLLIVLFLFSWFMIKPKLSQLVEQRSQLNKAEAQLAGVKSDKKKLSTLIEDLRDASGDVAKIDEALPLNGRISKVYVMLDDYVRTSGMTLTLISADDTSKTTSAGDKSILANPYQDGRQLHTVTLTTTVSGTMEQFKNFLQLVETSSRVLEVESVEVDGGEAQTKFKITVKAFSYEKLDGNILQ